MSLCDRSGTRSGCRGRAGGGAGVRGAHRDCATPSACWRGWRGGAGRRRRDVGAVRALPRTLGAEAAQDHAYQRWAEATLRDLERGCGRPPPRASQRSQPVDEAAAPLATSPARPRRRPRPARPPPRPSAQVMELDAAAAAPPPRAASDRPGFRRWRHRAPRS